MASHISDYILISKNIFSIPHCLLDLPNHVMLIKNHVKHCSDTKQISIIGMEVYQHSLLHTPTQFPLKNNVPEMMFCYDLL